VGSDDSIYLYGTPEAFSVDHTIIGSTAAAGSFGPAIIKLSPDGTTLDYVAYLSGDMRCGVSTIYDQPTALINAAVGGPKFGAESSPDTRTITITPTGDLVIVGRTTDDLTLPNLQLVSAALPANAIDPNRPPREDAVVARVRGDGTAVQFSTVIGGSDGDTLAYGLALDALGDIYVTGATSAHLLPTVSAAQGQYGGGQTDAFVSKIRGDGSALLYQTYLGGGATQSACPTADVGRGLAVDANGAAVIHGYTNSADFPGTTAANAPGPADSTGYCRPKSFITRLAPSGAQITLSLYADPINDLLLQQDGFLTSLSGGYLPDARTGASVLKFTSAGVSSDVTTSFPASGDSFSGLLAADDKGNPALAALGGLVVSNASQVKPVPPADSLVDRIDVSPASWGGLISSIEQETFKPPLVVSRPGTASGPAYGADLATVYSNFGIQPDVGLNATAFDHHGNQIVAFRAYTVAYPLTSQFGGGPYPPDGSYPALGALTTNLGTLVYKVSRQSNQVTVSVSKGVVAPGETFTVSAQVAGNAPTGQVQFKLGDTVIALVAVDPATGSARAPAQLAALGVSFVSARYLGDATHLAANSAYVAVQGQAITPPQVHWVEPAFGSTYDASQNVLLQADVTAGSQPLAAVQFFARPYGGTQAQLLLQLVGGPGRYSANWVHPPPGDYELWARAVDA
ncbi:MAG: Ig-like domain repeat protein, partial [Betaproteobacteria bacterium]|nr:Ig-like domain repeat protein [Betaproteobacteria bacterium]